MPGPAAQALLALNRRLGPWKPPPTPRHRAEEGRCLRRYGSGNWMPAPKCRVISEFSCDLTNETLEPTKRYYAQVRAVSGNRTSAWTRTNAFSPREGSGALPSPSPLGTKPRGTELPAAGCGLDRAHQLREESRAVPWFSGMGQLTPCPGMGGSKGQSSRALLQSSEGRGAGGGSPGQASGGHGGRLLSHGLSFAATLRLAGVHLSVTGNTIHVSVQLPLRVGNVTVSYTELYKHSRQYLVLVNRTSDHEQVSRVRSALQVSPCHRPLNSTGFLSRLLHADRLASPGSRSPELEPTAVWLHLECSRKRAGTRCHGPATQKQPQ